MVLELLSVVASRLPPARPLSKEERGAIDPPLRAVLYKYGAEWPPEWQLAIALVGVALPRWLEAKAKAAPVDPDAKAA